MTDQPAHDTDPGTDPADEHDQDAEPTTTAPPGGSPTDQEQIDRARAAEAADDD